MNNVTDSATKNTTPQRRPVTTLLLVVGFGILAFFAFNRYQQHQQQLINGDYFRLITEASSEFNHGLERFYSFNEHGGLASKHFSYKSLGEKSTCQIRKYLGKKQYVEPVYYKIQNNQLISHLDKYFVGKCFSVALDTLLPNPKNQFSQLFIATNKGKILAQRGNNKSLSLAKMTSLNRAIARRDQQSLFNFSQKKTLTDKPTLMPGHLEYIDKKMGNTEMRVFILPFKMNSKHQLTVDDKYEEYLYIVALLPKQKVVDKQSEYYSVPFVLAATVLLVAIWFLANLFLLPLNKVLNKHIQWLTISTCFMLLISGFTVIIANIQFKHLNEQRLGQTQRLMTQTNASLTTDIDAALQELKSFNSFFNHKINGDLLQLTNSNDSIQLNSDVYVTSSDKCGSLTECINTARFTAMVPSHLTASTYRNRTDYAHTGDNASVPVAINVSQPEQPRDWPALKTATIIDNEGLLTTEIRFIESPLTVKNLKLSHRDYVTKLWQHNGWMHQDSNIPFYIQRLFNVTSGTLGTTLSTPLAKTKENPNSPGYILAADILLPSLLDLTALSVKDNGKNSVINDVKLMIIDRLSGDVLFHSHNKQSLKENIFHLGHHQEQLIDHISASLDSVIGRPNPNSKPARISGSYHGINGKFIVSKTNVKQWALVAFVADNGLVTYTTNAFLYAFILLSILALFSVSCWSIWCALCRHNGKTEPGHYDFYCYQISLLSCCFLLLLIQTFIGSYATVISLVSLLMAWLWCRRTNKLSSLNILYRGYFVVMVITFSLLIDLTSTNPLHAFKQHQSLLNRALVNQELSECVDWVNELYPESSRYGLINKESLMPLRCQELSQVNKSATYARLDTTPSFARITKFSYVSSWLKNIFLSSQSNDLSLGNLSPDTMAPNNIPPFDISNMLAWLLLCVLWVVSWHFMMIKQLLPRLFGCPTFHQDIENISQQVAQPSEETIEHNRPILHYCDTVTGGRSLVSQLKHAHVATIPPEATKLMNQLRKELYPDCEVRCKEDDFPNIKLAVNYAHNEIQVALWDIELALSQQQSRRNLFGLLVILKDLHQEKTIHALEVKCGYNTFQRLSWHDDFILADGCEFERRELLSWAEYLMDFEVSVDEKFKKHINGALLEQELNNMPELKKIFSDQQLAQIPRPTQANNNTTLDHCTLNFAVLHFESLYRFKWELCNAAEKLALFHLANGHHINPRNQSMISHLAIKGLIKVSDQQNGVRLVNQSFAYFIRHAESHEMIVELTKNSELGLWQHYKLPFTVLIVMAIFALAFFSGQSFLVVLGAITGVFSSLVGLSNNLGMLRIGSG